MKFLLDNKLAPLTFSWGFIEADLETTVRVFSKWQRMTLRLVRHTALGVVPLANALAYLPPMDTGAEKSLFVSTKSKWTAYFENAFPYPQPGTVIGYLCEKMKCHGLTCSSIPNTLTRKDAVRRGSWGAVGFTVFSPHPREFLNIKRRVWLSNDASGWTFETIGDALGFEEVDSYRAKRTSQKFSSEKLENYFKFFDIDLFNEEFYHGEAVGVRSYYPLLSRPYRFSLAEARERLGLPVIEE